MSQNVLVTGTSSGFGRLTALTLARRGHRVFAGMRDTTGRRSEAAASLRQAGEEIAGGGGGSITVVDLDVASDASVQAAVAAVLEKAGHLDVVVNNAGVSAVGIEETLTTEQIERLFQVNVFGSHRVIRAALPSMRARGKGLIVQVTSSAGRYVLPFMGAYSGSKAALESLLDAYRYELKPTGIECAIVQPGAFPTEFTKNGMFGADQERSRGYGPLEHGVEQMFGGLAEVFKGPNAPDPQLVADAVVRLVESPAGSRPDRVVVDPMTGQAVESLNQAHRAVQKALLAGMGMGALAE
ncbi:MAG TPA: SDR family oxidoreductase [Nannocystis sp.]